jgi:RNA polymerase sigma-70 factor, ECF subfamily
MRQADVAGLMMRHRNALYSFVYAIVRSHSDAEDILQTVTVAAMESAQQLDNELGFLPWAREIARRRIMPHLRATRREQACDPELVQSLSDAAMRIDVQEPLGPRQAALRECLEHLPKSSRDLIAARYDRMGDAEQLAQKFGHSSVQAVYARIKRIKTALRKCVEKRLGAEETSEKLRPMA